MALGPTAFHACCCQYHWQAGLCRTKSWKLINSAGLTSQPFDSAVSLRAVRAANIFFRAPYQDRSSVLPKCLKAQNDTEWEKNSFYFRFWELCFAPFIKAGKSQNDLFSEEEQRLLPLLFLPFPSSLAVKTNGASFASWQDASLLW